MTSESSWVSPPELDSIPKPRPTKLSTIAKRTLVPVGLICLIGTAFYGYMFYMGLKRHQQFEVLHREGVRVSARAGEKRYIGGKGNHYRLTYYYQVGAQTYQNNGWITYNAFQSLQPGNPVDVIYLPAQPQIARLSTEGDVSTYRFFLILPLITFSAFMPVALQIGKQKKLLELGDSAKATIGQMRRVKNGYSVSYRFQDAIGHEIEGKTFVSFKRVPTEGDTATALYLPNDSSKNVLYPTPMVDLITS
jgi:hypothetical protein